MTPPRLKTILTHDAPGEFRAVAVDETGQSWRSFSQAWGGEGELARTGQVVSGRLRADRQAQGGAFVELDTGQEVFVSAPDLGGVSQGAAVNVLIAAEARQDKLARGHLTDAPPTAFDAFAMWQESIPGGTKLEIREDATSVEAAFDEAISETVTLPRGGRVHIERTRALTAIDVDSAGRITKGSAGARALSLNREAAFEAARQIALRNLGGAIIIDCVGPLNQASGGKVRETFLQAFKAVSTRRVEALQPSRFGLMEIALAWQSSPVGEAPQAEGASELLAILRSAQREAEADGAALLQIELSESAYAAYSRHRATCDDVLTRRFGGRLVMARSEHDRTDVRRR